MNGDGTAGAETTMKVAGRPRSDEAALMQEILEQLCVTLIDRTSPLVTTDGLDSEFAAQVTSILDETFRSLGIPGVIPPAIAVEYRSPEAMTRTAELRASQNHHPAESLMAAEALFGVALPFVVEFAHGRNGADAVIVAQTLHHAVWRRFPPGAIAYVDVLRQKLSTANQESRNSVARELHDRVSHNVAACIQRIELGILDLPERAGQPHFNDAITILRAALSDVQSIAFDLRQRVGTDHLDDAIRAYVQNVVGSTGQILVNSRGRRSALPPAQAEEVFMIVIEAIRNSRRHAGSVSRVSVELSWTEAGLHVSIEDDGPGFEADHVETRSLGIIGMKERAAAIGATLTFSSRTSGTRCEVALPFTVSAS